jgi:hypothetical protein
MSGYLADIVQLVTIAGCSAVCYYVEWDDANMQTLWTVFGLISLFNIALFGVVALIIVVGNDTRPVSVPAVGVPVTILRMFSEPSASKSELWTHRDYDLASAWTQIVNIVIRGVIAVALHFLMDQAPLTLVFEPLLSLGNVVLSEVFILKVLRISHLKVGWLQRPFQQIYLYVTHTHTHTHILILSLCRSVSL